MHSNNNNNETFVDVTSSVTVSNEWKKLTLDGHDFTRDKINKSTFMYRCCRYQAERCPMRIRYDFDTRKFWLKGGQHTHSLESEPKISKAEWLNQKNSIASVVKEFAPKSQLADLMIDPQCSMTLDTHEEFARAMSLRNSSSMVYFISEWQKQRINEEIVEPSNPKELILDITPINTGANSSQQMQVVTLLKKNSIGTAEPCAFAYTFSNDEKGFISNIEEYFFNIKNSAPNLKRNQHLIFYCDFDKSLHNIVQEAFASNKQNSEKTRTLCGTWFHLHSAVSKWINSNSSILKMNTTWNSEFLFDLEKLVRYCTNFEHEKNELLAKWTSRDFKLAQYLRETFTEQDSVFPPKMWCYALISTSFGGNNAAVDQIDREAEQYHCNVNRLFNLPRICDLKQGVNMLQAIEKAARENKLHALNRFTLVDGYLNAVAEGDMQEYSRKTKSSTMQHDIPSKKQRLSSDYASLTSSFQIENYNHQQQQQQAK